MAELKVRGISPKVVKELDELAGKKNMSREEYLRRYINKLAAMPETEQIEEKYTSLVKVLAEQLKERDEIIEVNNMLLEKIWQKLKSDDQGGSVPTEDIWREEKGE